LTGTGSQAGFTLLETLIAFLIVSVALGIAAQTVFIATRSFETAAGLHRAEDLAHQLQLETQAEGFAAQEGTRGGMRWRLLTTPIDPGAKAAFVTLEITAGSGRHYTFLLFRRDLGGRDP